MAPPDDFGWAYIDPQRASASADGPETSVQFRYGADSLIPGKFSGSNDLTFQPNDLTNQAGPGSGSVLSVTGALYVSGTIYADNYTIREITSTQIEHSGSTTFGDTTDDNHQITGSLWVSHTMSGSHTLHIVSSSSFGDYMTFHHTITGAAAADMSVAAGAGDIHVNKAILNDLRVSGSSVKGANANTTHQITGSLEVSNTAVFAGAVQASQYIKHMGDLDTFIRFQADDINVQAGGVDFIKITEDDSQDTITFNEGGADVDFRVESDNGTHAIFVDAGNDVVHINQNEAAVTTQIHNDNDVAITVSATEVVINDDSHASIDFRVESDGEDEAIFLDSSANILYVNKGETAVSTRIASVNDIAITVASAGVILNEDGHATNDFRAETSGEDEAIFLDSGANELHINKGETAFATTIRNVNDVAMSIGAAGVIFNQDGHATNDFRVESDNFDHALFVDAGSDTMDISASLGPLTGSGEIHAAKLVGNDLAVSGSSIKGANAATTHQVTGSFEVSGPANFTSVVNAEGPLFVLGLLTATGKAILGDATDDTVQVTGSLEVSAPTWLNNNLYVPNGSVVLGNGIAAHQVSGALFHGGDHLSSSGGLSIQSSASFGDAITFFNTISGSLNGGGGADVHADKVIINDLWLSGSSIIGVNANTTHQVTGSLEVSGPANFTSVVNAEGPLFVYGLLTATGNAVLGNNAADTHQVTGSLEVSGPAHFTSEVHAEAALNVDGAITVLGNTTLGDGLGDVTTFAGTLTGSHPDGTAGGNIHANSLYVNDLYVSGTTSGVSVTYADSAAITFGADSDFTIVHDGSNTKLTNTTGHLWFDNTDSDDNIRFDLGTDDTATKFQVRNNSGTNLWHVLGDGLVSGSGNLAVQGSASFGQPVTISGDLVFNAAATAGVIDIKVNDGSGADTAIQIAKAGKVTKIGDDTPSDGQLLTWDETAGKVKWDDGVVGISGSSTHYSGTELRTSGDLNVSGSTILGTSLTSNIQVSGTFEVAGPSHFTGEVHAEDILNVDGVLTATGGTVLGNASGDTHQVTGSLEVSGPGTWGGHPVFNTGLTIKNADASAGYINFYEQSSNGTNVCTFRGKSSMGNCTITLPGDTGTVVLEDNTVTLSNKTIASPTFTGVTTTGGAVVIGSDADGTDRTVTFGHSTLKTIMGIDDSADCFIINTDATFDGTILNNSLVLDSAHNLLIAGNITTAGNLTVADDIVHKGDTDTKIEFDTDKITITAGAQEFIQCHETTQNTLIINPEGEDIDFKLMAGGGSGVNGSIFMQGNDGTVHISGTLGPMSGSGEMHCTKFVANDLATSGSTILGSTTASDTHQVTGSFEVSGPANFTSQVRFEDTSPDSLSMAQDLAHIGDADTLIRFTTDQITMFAGNSNLLDIDEDGASSKVVVNESGIDCDFRVESENITGSIFVEASTDSVHLCGNAFTFNDDGVFRVHPDGNAPGKVVIHSRDTTSADASELKFERYTDASFASGDNLGEIHFRGSEDEDGTYYTGASIVAEVDEAGWANGSSNAGRLLFYTTADGATTGTERMRIDNAGLVTIANALASVTVIDDLTCDGSSPKITIRCDSETDSVEGALKFIKEDSVQADNTNFGSIEWYSDEANDRMAGRLRMRAVGSMSDSDSQGEMRISVTPASSVSANLSAYFTNGDGNMLYLDGNVSEDAFHTEGHQYIEEGADIDYGAACVLSNGKIQRSSAPKQKNVCGIAWRKVALHKKDLGFAEELHNVWVDGTETPKTWRDSLGVVCDRGKKVGDEWVEGDDYAALWKVASIGDSRQLNSDGGRASQPDLAGFKVCDEGGSIEAGDLLCTSAVPGHLMKQDDDLMHGYTVAKAMEDVTFDEDGKAVGIYGYLYCG